jgi:hypothetical protein
LNFHILKFCGLLLLGFILMKDDGCDNPTPDKQMTEKQMTMNDEANRQVGMPGITNFTEKKLVRTLYELRDQNIVTYAYVPDLQGRLWHLCDSIGYGLPYGVQFSNPQRPAYGWETHEAGNIALPQAEPNGLFMPSTAEGTWVTCQDPIQKGKIAPVYVEPRVIVSPFKLQAFGDYAPVVAK